MAAKATVIILFFLLHNSIAVENWTRAGYWQSDTNSLNIQSINATLYTHLIYGFADVQLNSSTIIVSVSDDAPLKSFNSIVKGKNPSLKTLLSIGAPQSHDTSSLHLLMDSFFSRRKLFIEASIQIARLHGFDGLDFCWISPNSTKEMANLATLLDDWRSGIESESKTSSKPRLLLTMAVQYTPWFQDASYPIESMRINLDWVHVFAFDYYNSITTKSTAPFAALYDPRSNLNSDYGINSWIQSGFPSQKLVLGLPFYGYVWTLVDPENNKIGAASIGPGPKNYSIEEPFPSQDGLLNFNDIKRGIIKYRVKASYNGSYVMNYVSVGKSWVGFDDAGAVKAKVSYSKQRHLRGYVAWQVSYDWNSVLSQAAAGEVEGEETQGGGIDQPETEIHKKKRQNRLIIILIPVGAVLVVLLLLVPTLWCLIRKKQFQVSRGRHKVGSEREAKRGNGESSSLHVFTFDEMKVATNDFSEDNKLGQGGYGPVYKGKLRNGQEIAVKRLKEGSSQGLQEFENETILTARLQHINLVKVIGFCIERNEKMLIYEYMPNKSLDHYIYNQGRRLLLNWEKRVQIIEGIIQGLLYLQEYSRLTIIHRDLKASNILMDKDMKPKISDFGMARIFNKDEVNEANTKRVVGTMGYMGPEYVKQGIYSTKSDVFSFGVLLLQIISGKKNTCLHGPDENLNLLEYAFEMWKDGKGMEFMDESLDDTTSPCKLLKCMHIALLCVQKDPLHRPTMLQVSSMLKDTNLAMSSPRRPAFSARDDEQVNNPSGSSQEMGDVDTATITQLVAR